MSLFPELVSTPEIRASLINHWRSQSRPAPIVVPGSEHVLHHSEKANISTIVTTIDAHDSEALAAIPWYTHKKFAPTTGVRDGQPYTREPIDPQPVRLRVHLTPALKVGLLICRDFLVDSALELVRKLEIDVLIVPAMTPTFDSFQGPCEDLARRSLAEVYRE